MGSTAAGQRELFDDLHSGGPAGLRYEPEFIGEDEERELLAAIVALPLHEAEYRGYTAKRRIASFGAGYDFDANVLRPAPAVPAFLRSLRGRVAERLDVEPASLTHALVTEYRPGTALGWHRDVPDFDTIAGLSLASTCRMRFRPYPPTRGDKAFVLELAPRSLYVLAGAARWRWQHGIPPTPALRYSITFRTLGTRARRANPDD